MALEEPIKKGGRYTRKEQEERRLEVHQLHFVEKKSSVDIAKLLAVNRNTINEDIKFWYNQVANQSNVVSIVKKMIRQIQRMEIQRGRFVEYLDEAKNLDEIIRIENLICQLDARLIQYYSKSILKNKRNLSSDNFAESLSNQF